MKRPQKDYPSYKIGNVVIDGRIGQVRRGRTDLEFTFTEFEVFLELVNRAGQVVRREEFPTWPKHVGDAGQRHPVDDIVSRIRKRLGNDLRIERVWGQGYRLIPSTPITEIPSPSSPESDRLSVLALDRMNLHTLAALRSSIRNYEKRLRIDSDPNTYVNLAMDYINLGHTGFCQELPLKAAEKAMPLIEEATTSYPTFSSGYALRGLAHLIYEYEWNRARRDFDKALELDPDDSYAHLFLAHLEVAQRKFESGLTHARRAAELDWRSPMTVFTLPWMLVFAGQPAEALREAEKALLSFDPFAIGHEIRGWGLEFEGRTKEALAAYEKSLEIEFFPSTLASLGHLLAKQGKRNAALDYLKALRDTLSVKKIAYVSGYFEALVFVGLGDHRRALDALEKARVQRCDWLIYLDVEPRWQPLRGSKRFERLLQEMGLQRG